MPTRLACYQTSLLNRLPAYNLFPGVTIYENAVSVAVEIPLNNSGLKLANRGLAFMFSERGISTLAR